ncbi:unnamed protein product [Prorocentrum cordatum]|uniref:Uncharacterized protein n=1 Tax=Prorocentrum cordatum TaxID=2364126 RepID=A0ABN9T5S0_9DINO|nr:unnamed protein product [Polarella glacialis]
MDPQACLEILTQAASQAAKDHQGEAALGGLCCAAAGARAAGLAVGEGPGLRPVFPSDVGFAAEEDEVKPKKFCPPCGEPLPGERTRVNDTEVIDLATGTNETIESELTEVGLLGRFPALAGEPDLGGRPPDLAAGPASLVASVVRLHGARVVVHKAYDAAFQHLLTSKAGGQHALQRMYPFVVSCATARFKALSEGVRAAAAALEEAAAAPGAEEAVAEAAALVRRLQGLEAARLQLVAAHHVEQSRLKARPGGDEGPCRDIRQRLGAAAEAIEEAVSELRYCAADLGA